MEDTKPWWQSTAVWGGIIAGLAGLAGLFGYQIDQVLQTDATAWVAGLAAAVGGFFAIWGRIKASKKVA